MFYILIVVDNITPKIMGNLDNEASPTWGTMSERVNPPGTNTSHCTIVLLSKSSVTLAAMKLTQLGSLRPGVPGVKTP